MGCAASISAAVSPGETLPKTGETLPKKGAGTQGHLPKTWTPPAHTDADTTKLGGPTTKLGGPTTKLGGPTTKAAAGAGDGWGKVQHQLGAIVGADGDSPAKRSGTRKAIALAMQSHGCKNAAPAQRHQSRPALNWM